MPNITFPCPFCSKKMAVGDALLGRKVRCPSCKEIVLAPAAEAAAPIPVPVPPAPPPVQPVPSPVSPPPARDLPEFKFLQEKREAADSILGDPEESEDEIFGSSPGVNLRTSSLRESEPPKPEPLHVPAPEPTFDNPFGFEASVPPPPPVRVEPPPAPPVVAQVVEEVVEAGNPFNAFEEPPQQPISIPVPVPPAQPVVVAVPEPVAMPVTDGNPFSAFDDLSEAPTTRMPTAVQVHVPQQMPVAQPSARAVAVAEIEEEPEDPRPQKRRPKLARRATAAVGQRSGPGMGFYILLGYAVLMTAMTLYGFLFRYGTQLDPGHPLSTIPDNFGEFPAAERKKVSQLNRIIEGDLPPEQIVALGKKLEIGQLEIEPLKVETRHLTVHSLQKSGRETKRTTQAEAVVLTLRIRNTSDDLTIYPMDPAFTRKFIGTTDEPKPGTALVVGKDIFRGGEIAWPPAGRFAAEREFEELQQQDAVPLKPHESREYIVFTAAENRIAKKVMDSNEPMLWRVQVRRGVIDFKDAEVPVTAIVGVEFKSSDVNEN